jgi:hypothetical protein
MTRIKNTGEENIPLFKDFMPGYRRQRTKGGWGGHTKPSPAVDTWLFGILPPVIGLFYGWIDDAVWNDDEYWIDG